MKIKLKKTVKSILTVGAVIAPVSLAVSCANEKNYGDSWQLKSHRNLNLITTNAEGINDTYGSPSGIVSYEYSSNSVNTDVINSQQLGLFSKVKQKFDSFYPKKDPQNPKIIKIETALHRDSFLKFDLLKGVKLNFLDNGKQSITFDSDKIDKNDKKSINGDNFEDTVKKNKLKSIEFIFKDKIVNGEAYWTEELSGKKKGKLKVEDIWTYFQFSIHKNDTTREAEFKKLFSKKNNNNSVIEKINGYINSFSSAARFDKANNSHPPSYWVSSSSENNYGLDYEKFRNTKKNKYEFLGINNNSSKNPKKVVIPFKGTTEGQKQWLFWQKEIKNRNIFAISTDNIQRLISKYKIPRDKFEGFSDDDYQRFIDSDLYKTGVYSWYLAQSEKDYVVGGKYYLSKNDKKIRELKDNKNYINYDYFFNKLKNKNTGKNTTLLTITENFMQDSNLKDTILLQSYKEGFSPNASTISLSSSEYIDMIKNPKKWGMLFTQGYTSNKLLGDYSGWHLVPGSTNPDIYDYKSKKMVPGKENYNVYYNDWFAKVMWGHSIKELLKQQQKVNEKLKGLDWADNYFGGTGIQFISNLMAALNSYTSVHNYIDSRQEWTSVLAPENEIIDYSGKKRSTIYQAHPEKLEDSDGRKDDLIKTTSKFGVYIYGKNNVKSQNFKEVRVDRKDYVKVNKNPKLAANRKYGPPQEKLNIIKENIKNALDAAGVPLNEKVTFEWPIGRGLSGIKENIIYKEVIKWLNSLDQRINIVAKIKPHKENVEEFGSNVITKDYTRNFSGLSKSIGGGKPWISRLLPAQRGYNAMNISNSGIYSKNSPAGGIFSNLGYLQSGKLMGLSYYSDHEKLISGDSTGKNNVLAGLKNIFDVAKEKFKDFFKSLDEENYQSNEVKSILKKLKNNPPKFNELYKNTIGDIVSYDYLGMHGFEDFKKLLKDEKSQNNNYKDYSIINSDIQKFNSKLSALLSLDFMFSFQEKMEDNTYDQISVLKSIAAFNILVPQSLNPLMSIIGSRKYPSINLRKNWLFFGFDKNGFESYEWYRVDLAKNNKNGEIIGGGIS